MADAIPLKIYAGDDLTQLTASTVYIPTQKEIYEGNVNQYTDLMRTNNWDWNRTATDPLSPIIVDSQNHIVAGHHRILAAIPANVEIPEYALTRLQSVTFGVPRPWGQVEVRANFR